MESFKIFEDERGVLVPINFSELPFIPKRIFYIYNIPKNTWRGGHAHYNTRQILICLQGKIRVKLEKSDSCNEFILEKNEWCLIENLVWDSQEFLTDDSVAIVLCSTEYDKKDYITDRENFLEKKT